MDITTELRKRVTELFDEGKITRFIGYKQGSLPYKAKPYIITKKEDVENLIFNPFCINNISIYLKYPDEKVGIVAHTCVLRSIVMLLQGNQINADNIYIIGVSCGGMIDADKIKDIGFMKIKSWEFKDDKFIINTEGGTKEYKKSDIAYDKCSLCVNKTPKIYNEFIGEIPEGDSQCGEDEYKIVEDMEKLSLEERWDYWQKQFNKCVRCYACRNVCPVCYCKECVVDKIKPQWVTKLNQPSMNEYYNLIRVLHVMGRCVDCGECERVCPSKIPYRKLIKKMEKDVKELYGYVPGLDPETLPPLTTFKEEDPEKEIK